MERNTFVHGIKKQEWIATTIVLSERTDANVMCVRNILRM